MLTEEGTRRRDAWARFTASGKTIVGLGSADGALWKPPRSCDGIVWYRPSRQGGNGREESHSDDGGALEGFC